MFRGIKQKIVSTFQRKQVQYQSEKVEIFPYLNLENELAFTTGVVQNYDAYEEAYFKSVDVSTAIDLIAHYAITDFSFAGPEKDIKKAEEFAKKVGLRSRLINDVRTMLIYGNGYEFIARDADGYTLQYLNPKKVTVKVDKYGAIKAYTYSVGAQQDLDPERVMHFAYGRLGNSPYGYSLVHQVYETIVLKQKIERVASVLAHRMSHPLIHAKVKNPMRINDVANALKERIQEDSTTAEGLKILNEIVTDDAVDINVLGSQLDITGIVKVLEYLQNQVDKALKVPKVFYGEPEGSNRATSYNQLKTFSLFLNSLRSVVTEELEKKLFPTLNLDVEIEFDEIVIEDELIWGDLAVKLYEAGIINTNEARELVGFPELPNE